MKKLYSIGYAGASQEMFIDILLESKVDFLVDVRELPISRKRGFSKSGLAQSLKSVGISYLHLKQLGSPSSLRNEVRKTANYPLFFDGMRKHLAEPDSVDCLTALSTIANSSTCCIMCFCADSRKCHRKTILDALGDRFVIHNLGIEKQCQRVA